jgi:hypothetical protein
MTLVGLFCRGVEILDHESVANNQAPKASAATITA